MHHDQIAKGDYFGEGDPDGGSHIPANPLGIEDGDYVDAEGKRAKVLDVSLPSRQAMVVELDTGRREIYLLHQLTLTLKGSEDVNKLRAELSRTEKQLEEYKTDLGRDSKAIIELDKKVADCRAKIAFLETENDRWKQSYQNWLSDIEGVKNDLYKMVREAHEEAAFWEHAYQMENMAGHKKLRDARNRFAARKWRRELNEAPARQEPWETSAEYIAKNEPVV